MDELLERNKLAQFNQHEIDHLNSLITIKRIEFAI